MQILVSGSLAYDRIMDFPGKFEDHILPDKIHILNVCFTVRGLSEQFGGTAGNIAYSLALLGEIDPNVPSLKSAARLRSLDKDNISVKVYEGSAHALQDPIGQGNRYIREDALQDIVAFINSAASE